LTEASGPIGGTAAEWIGATLSGMPSTLGDRPDDTLVALFHIGHVPAIAGREMRERGERPIVGADVASAAAPRWLLSGRLDARRETAVRAR